MKRIYIGEVQSLQVVATTPNLSQDSVDNSHHRSYVCHTTLDHEHEQGALSASMAKYTTPLP